MFKKLEEILNVSREMEYIIDVQIKILDMKIMPKVKKMHWAVTMADWI